MVTITIYIQQLSFVLEQTDSISCPQLLLGIGWSRPIYQRYDKVLGVINDCLTDHRLDGYCFESNLQDSKYKYILKSFCSILSQHNCTLMRKGVVLIELTISFDERMEEARQRKKDNTKILSRLMDLRQSWKQLKLDQGEWSSSHPPFSWLIIQQQQATCRLSTVCIFRPVLCY